jgi:hypothetical protein
MAWLAIASATAERPRNVPYYAHPSSEPFQWVFHAR